MKINKLSSMFGEQSFLEEGCLCKEPTQFIKEENKEISESKITPEGTKCLGKATGVFAVLDGSSRNKRFYPANFWRKVISEPVFQDRVTSRSMQGTIGHHDKMVDNEDWAEGLISHVITDIKIDEDNQVVIGEFEILDTPAGRLLKTYYDSKLPVYVSSRGAGKLLRGIGEQLDVVDENNYYLHTWDIVNDPGFVQAQPEYCPAKININNKLNSIQEEVSTVLDKGESKSKSKDINKLEHTINEEEQKMEIKLDKEMSSEEIIKALLNPIQESVKNLQESISKISEEKNEKIEKLEESVKKITEDKEAEEEKEAKKEESEKLEKYEKVEEANKSLVEEVLSLKKEIETIKEEYATKVEEQGADREKERVLHEDKLKEFEKISEELVNIAKAYDEKKSEILEQVKKEQDGHEATRGLLSEANKSLDSYKLVEEFGITIEEAKEKLADKSIDEAKVIIKEEREIIEEARKADELAESQKKINESLEEASKFPWLKVASSVNEEKEKVNSFPWLKNK